MIQLVVFDVAGTTVNDPDLVGGCLRSALERVGVGVPDVEMRRIMGTPKPVAIAELIEGRNVGKSVHEIHSDFVRSMLETYREHPDVRPIEGIVEVFQALREHGIKVALDTGFDRPILDAVLDRLNWKNGVVDASISSDEVRAGRPAPDLVYEAMRRTGVTEIARVAKVGDTAADLNEGANAGCSINIGVTYGTHAREQLVSHPHTHLVDAPEQILTILGIRP